MPRDEALEVVQRYLEQYDPRYLAEDIELDLVPGREPLHGRAAAASQVHDLRHRRFTDVDVDVTNLRLAGDQVVVEAVATARRRSYDRPVGGRRVTARIAAIVTVADGEIRCAHVYFDSAEHRVDLPLSPAAAGSRLSS